MSQMIDNGLEHGEILDIRHGKSIPRQDWTLSLFLQETCMDALKRRSGCQMLVGGAGTMGYSRTYTHAQKYWNNSILSSVGVFS